MDRLRGMHRQGDKSFGPSPGPQGVGQSAFFFSVANPNHVSNLHTKFGWILPNG